MPFDPKKRQKKQERRAALRKSKQRELTREKHAGLPDRLSAAAKYPILHCWATADIWEKGLGWVCLSRVLPNGSVAYSVFLVDRYCLGVKNAMAQVTSRFDYDTRVARKMHFTFKSKDLHPAAARKLVEGAVEYAGALGLHPHADYHKAKLLFGDIDASECTETFEFGKDGKPFFISGPNDTPERCHQILEKLVESCGRDGFHYLIPLADPSSVLPKALKAKEVRVIGEDETGTIQDCPMDLSEEPDQPGGQE
jgi:hypothetical protein